MSKKTETVRWLIKNASWTNGTTPIAYLGHHYLGHHYLGHHHKIIIMITSCSISFRCLSNSCGEFGDDRRFESLHKLDHQLSEVDPTPLSPKVETKKLGMNAADDVAVRSSWEFVTPFRSCSSLTFRLAFSRWQQEVRWEANSSVWLGQELG